jgi:hypothetical protein
MKEERSTPLVPQLVLLVGFILLAVAGIVTVVLPELATEDGTKKTEEAANQREQGQ